MLTLDTDTPGFEPAWRVDLTRGYRRDLFAQKGSGLGVLATTSVTEQVNVIASAASGLPERMRRASAIDATPFCRCW